MRQYLFIEILFRHKRLESPRKKINCYANWWGGRGKTRLPLRCHFNIFSIPFVAQCWFFLLSKHCRHEICSSLRSLETTSSESDAENQFTSVTRTSPITRSRHQRDLERDNGLDVESDGDEFARNPLDRGPYFDIEASKNVTALVGSTAYLNCRVRNLGNKTVRRLRPESPLNDLISSHYRQHQQKVTWIRHRDLHLLTVGKATYTPDNRFQSVHNPHNDEWALKVRHKQNKKSFTSSLWVASSVKSIFNH